MAWRSGEARSSALPSHRRSDLHCATSVHTIIAARAYFYHQNQWRRVRHIAGFSPVTIPSAAAGQVLSADALCQNRCVTCSSQALRGHWLGQVLGNRPELLFVPTWSEQQTCIALRASQLFKAHHIEELPKQFLPGQMLLCCR